MRPIVNSDEFGKLKKKVSLGSNDKLNNPKEHTDYMKEDQNDIYCIAGQNITPVHSKFIEGIVESEELPLNISWKTLQLNKNLRVNKKNLIKKYIEMLAGNAEEDDEYKMNDEQYVELLNNMNLNLAESIVLTEPGFSHFYRCRKKHNYEQQKDMIVTALAQALKTLEKTKLNNMYQAG